MSSIKFLTILSGLDGFSLWWNCCNLWKLEIIYCRQHTSWYRVNSWRVKVSRWSTQHTAFATLLHYCVNSVGKKIFVPLALGQDWKSAASTGGDMCKRGFLGVRFIGLGNSLPGGTVKAALLEALKTRAGSALEVCEKKLFCSGSEQGLLQLWFFYCSVFRPSQEWQWGTLDWAHKSSTCTRHAGLRR